MVASSTTVTILLNSFLQAHAKVLMVNHAVHEQDFMDKLVEKFVDKLCDRALKMWPLHHRDLDNTSVSVAKLIFARPQPATFLRAASKQFPEQHNSLSGQEIEKIPDHPEAKLIKNQIPKQASSGSSVHREKTVNPRQRNADGRAWACDDTEEGTMHSGLKDLRIDGECGNPAEAVAATAARLSALAEQSRKWQRNKVAADGKGPAGGVIDEMLGSEARGSLLAFLRLLDHFELRSVSDGGNELALYDAMKSPYRALRKTGHFIAEGSIVVEQLLKLTGADGQPRFRLVSLLSTEQMLGRLATAIQRADEAYARANAAHAALPSGDRAQVQPCVVFSGSRADFRNVTAYKHSSVSILGIGLRPDAASQLVSPWLGALQVPAGMIRPTLLLLDRVTKPENIGSLFRTALAFGVAGVILSAGCADPLYRKAVRTSQGAVFKLPFLYAPQWPNELLELQRAGYGLLALHLQGSVEHTALSLDGDGGSSGGSLLGGSLLGDRPLGIIVGAEYGGMSDEVARLADLRVRIAMAPVMDVDEGHGVDSLNVNAAAAIVLERVFAANRAEDASPAGNAPPSPSEAV